MSANKQVVEAKTAELAAADPANVLERIVAAASDPNVDIDKFERLVAMRDKELERQAEAAFNVAMTAAQTAMRPVVADANNTQTNSKYATYKALDEVLRPIYTQHGFALSFNTQKSPIPENICVVCRVAHIGGFSRDYEIDMPADGKGPKGGDVMTKTHATGSATAYGMRYLLKMIFNVAITNDDDDGNAAGGRNIAQELLDYNAKLRENWYIIADVKKYLLPEWGEHANAHNVTAAREAYKELEEEEQKAIWRAPTKGGIWTTLERKLLKTPEQAGVPYI